jgi:2-oxo-4-hydroxy-4-carboxy--5-ureidoimidazoline (OHCU) decarboxylase
MEISPPAIIIIQEEETFKAKKYEAVLKKCKEFNDDVNKEFEESVKQVKKIALFRLEDSIDD